MIRKFECWNCNSVFDADDSNYVECPSCHSDNVEFYKWHLPKCAIWSLFIICFSFFAFLIIYNIDESKEEFQVSSSSISPILEIDVEHITESITPHLNECVELPKIVSGKLSFINDGYNIKVSLTNPPTKEYHFQVLEAFGDKVIATNNNGIFRKLPPSDSEGGSYRIVAKLNKNDSIIAIANVSGFIRQVNVTSKMSLEKLKELIDKKDKSLVGIGENEFLSPEYKLILNGLSDNSTNKPTLLAEVFEKLDMGIWESVSVSQIGYDEMNRINSITMFVVVSSIDF
ncbi:MAG: hypothetical protein HUJ68_12245 [Clostridia bacterium]|nr:hypothetical protein [Clostridia bacterium]